MMKTSGWVTTLVFALAASMAMAQIYKWKDANGKTHYSDTPPLPSQAKPELLNTNDAPVSSITTVKAPSITSPAASAVASQAAQKAPKDPAACKAAQGRKTFLLSGQLTKSVNDKGEVEFMSEAKRNSELAQVEKEIKAHCP